MLEAETHSAWRLLTAVGAAAAGAAVVTGAALRRVQVTGLSMTPTFAPGDRLLVVRGRRARPGEVVVVRRPGGAEAVKRVAAGADVLAGEVVVLGDNPAASTDSRHHGPLPRGAVRGRVVARYHPPERVGCLGAPGSLRRAWRSSARARR